LDGKGKILDIQKLAVHRNQKERKAIISQFKEVLKKDRMDKGDYGIFFQALSAKQKRTLALMGLASLMGRFSYNPQKILAEIDGLKE
jgi:hypothetical protein